MRIWKLIIKGKASLNDGISRKRAKKIVIPTHNLKYIQKSHLYVV